MFAVNTYEEIEKIEHESQKEHIIILLFVRPSLEKAKQIIDEFNYIHYNSEKACSIYAVGYTNDQQYAKENNFQKVKEDYGVEWYFSNLAFIKFKNNLEKRLKWRYTGEIEMLILQSNPSGRQILNFQNYVTVDLNYGIKQGYIDSFPRFMETLIRSSKEEVDAIDAIKDTRKQRYRVHKILEQSIHECKKLPGPIKTILQDKLFFKGSKHQHSENECIKG